MLGLSGGIDSALVAYLTAEAIGPERLLCPDALSDLVAGVAWPTPRRSSVLGCESELVDITPMVDGYFERRTGRDPLRRGNFMARARMMVLYDHSVTWGGLVVGTGNKTETLIGYTTIFGDSACAFNPIGDLYKSQVRQLAAAMGVPEQIIRKAPSADLWPGQTDEGEVGFSYADMDRMLFWLVDRRRSIDEVVADGLRPTRRSSGSTGWSRAPSSSARCRRSPSSGRGPPGSTTSIRAGGRDRRGWRRRPGRNAVRGRDAHRQPGRRHAAGARGPAVGAAGRGRGHAADAAPLGAPRARHALVSYHAQSARRRDGAS